MAGVTGNPFAGNRHADVLNEDPTDEAGKLRLVEEVKNRAKGAFSQKDMPSAEMLYGKAISLLDSIPGKAEAPLYSNRSMVRLNLNKVEGALEDAKKCVALDPTFVKAYHRKAQALSRLNEWDDAIAAAREGEKLDPNNKAFAELIEKCEQDKKKDEEDKAKLKRDAQDVRVELHNASTARAPPVKREKKEGDEASEMRGYKTNAEGKTTSYFHTDISEEAKELIAKQGFGKPQKLDAPLDEAKESKGGGSQWNQAGTYEEKNMTKYVKESLLKTLVGTAFQLPQGGNVSVTAVDDVNGPAITKTARGVRKHILDLSFDAKFEIKVGEETGSGKLCYSDVTADEGDDFAVKCEVDGSTSNSLREVVDAFVKPGGTGLQPLLSEAIKKFVADFKLQ